MRLNHTSAVIIFIALFFINLILVNYLTKTIRIDLPLLLSPLSVAPTTPISPKADTQNIRSTVLYVVDGDTIVTVDKQTIRYIGIDTPELHHPKKTIQCFAEEAKKINQALVDKKEVRIEKDVSETDRYKRLLRYVWVHDQNASNGAEIFVNDYLVRQGYAHAATFPPDVRYAQQFVQAEQEAREKRRGLWSKCN